MKRIYIVATCVVAALTAGATSAPASLADPPGSRSAARLLTSGTSSTAAPGSISPLLAKEIAVLMGQGISRTSAIQAIDVQGKIARADIERKLQSALGSAYAGVWFDNANARLRIGVTSRRSRAIVRRVVAQADVQGDVAITPVRSTVAHLIATQNRWNRKLKSLFARENVATAIEPQFNAVAITLSSSVPKPRRSALEREAASAGVDVLVKTVKGAHVGGAPQAKECAKFPPANCDPVITPGVSIVRRTAEISKGLGESHKTTTLDNFAEATLLNVLVGDTVTGPGVPVETIVTAKPTNKSVTISKATTTEQNVEFTFKTGATCTAGPVAIPQANRTERVLLTAGHCIEGGHGVGAEWFAFNILTTELLIGKAIEFVNGGAAGAKIGDYGDIKIEAGGGWQSGDATRPVLAVTAEWKKNAETRYPVIGERVPALKAMNCHEGRSSGGECGEVTALNVSITVNGKTAEGLVEDTAAGLGGDSGGPWVFVEATNDVRMEGTDVGEKGSTKNSVFMPLMKTEAGSPEGSLEKMKLDLLTTANERIRPAMAGGKFPVKFTTESKETKLETLKGRVVKCTASKGEGEISSATELKNAVVKFTGCKGKFTFLGEAPCSSAGAGKEEIVTHKLKATPVYLSQSKKEVALLAEPQEAEGLDDEFKCEKEKVTETVKVKGPTLGTFTPVNTSTTKFTAAAKQEKGKPNPSEYENEKGEKVKATTEAKGEGVEAFGYEGSGIEGTETLVTAEAVEVGA